MFKDLPGIIADRDVEHTRGTPPKTFKGQAPGDFLNEVTLDACTSKGGQQQLNLKASPAYALYQPDGWQGVG